MTTPHSFTIDVATAATLREWLFETAVENHGDSAISQPLAELAAAIDGELRDQAESVEISASARTVPPTDRALSVGEDVPGDAHDAAAMDAPAAGDTGDDESESEPTSIYEDLPDTAWQLDSAQQASEQDSPATAPDHEGTSSGQRRAFRCAVRYRTAYECAACGAVREEETSLQVCAFVDECATCGTVARFPAIEIPTPLAEH